MVNGITVAGLYKCVTNIPLNDPAVYGYDFTRWIVRFPAVRRRRRRTTSSQTYEVIVDDNNAAADAAFVPARCPTRHRPDQPRL